MSAQTTDGSLAQPVTIHKVQVDAPWSWLAAGWRDIWAAPGVSLLYGLLCSLISVVLVFALFRLELTSLILALAAGFLLVAPLLAVGLYEASRRHETGDEVTLKSVFLVSTKSPVQLAYMGVLMMIALLVWIRVATLLFALFFGAGTLPPLDQFVDDLFFSWRGLGMLGLGSAIGGFIAFVIFAASAVSIPMLLDRDVDAVTAVITSFRTVGENFPAMLLWGALIVMLTAFGIATLFVGAIITFPLVGHATWHAYRALVED